MLNRKFTLRETILILIAAVLALGIFYYQVIVKNYNEAKVTYNVSSLEDEMMVLTAQVSKKKTMEDYIENHSDEEVGEVAIYNNLANEIDALASVLDSKAENISITWNEPTLSEETVRRIANISLTASSYDAAKQIIREIANLEYRCIISQVSLSSGDSESLNRTSEVSLNMTVTFFETTVGSTSTSGLTKVDIAE
jgi:hypothetical protein